MSTATPTMPREKRNDVPVKLDAYVARLAKILAAHEDTTIAKIVSDEMEPILVARLKAGRIPIPPKPKRGTAEES